MKKYILLMFIVFISTMTLFSESNTENIKKSLKRNVKNDRNNYKYNFEFAQFLTESKKYDIAIKYYLKSMLEDSELGWYSEYMIGRCCHLKGDWDNALKYYNSCFERRPTRAEPLLQIADYYVSKGHTSEAYHFLLKGKDIPYPKDDALFIEKGIYKYRFKELLGIASYYIHEHRSKGLKYIDQIIFDRELSWDIKFVNLLNSLHYVENIKNAIFIPIDVTPPTLSDWSSDRYKPCNPSIVKIDDGYIVNCRCVNYVQWCPGHLFVDGSDRAKTRNIIVKYDRHFNKTLETCITEDPSLRLYNQGTVGLEDLRIFSLNNEIYFTGTTCQLHPGGIAKICLGKFEFDNSNMNIKVNKITLLEGPSFDRIEKNWMPFLVDGELLAIYSCDPYIVYKPCLSTGICPEFVHKDLGFDFSRLSGSAPPIPFDDGYLLMVHEGIWNHRRYYLHRFLYLDKNLELKKYSDAFTFKHKGIEMCCGMTIDHNNEKLIMAIGLEDREAYLCVTALDNIRSMLKDISELKI